MPILAKAGTSVRPALEAPQYESWQAALKDAVRRPQDLCRLLALPQELAAAGAAAQFPVFVPRHYLARIQPGDPHDPLLRQVLPVRAELQEAPDFRRDPVDDGSATLQPGLLQKYHGRALLITTGRCAVHCRYCFRRHYPYGSAPTSSAVWGPAVKAIAQDDTLREIILSGGDPLTIVDQTLAELVRQLASVPHLRRVRVHTRLPILIPQRVTSALIKLFRDNRLTPIIVVHANHLQELSDDVGQALARLVDGGIPLLNQAVLLRGVNDSFEAQASLCERLVNLRVMPYYLHQLDKVTGAAHFEVPVERGREIVDRLRSRLPGYAVPRYVQEVAGEMSKRPLI